MSAIGPGDYVECIQTHFDGEWDTVHAGRIYCVQAVYPEDACDPCAIHGPACAAPAFDIVGMPDDEYAWCAALFRPIYKPNADLIAHLLAPAPSVMEPA